MGTPLPPAKDLGDWIEAIIVLVIFLGSALGGLAKWISVKLNQGQPTDSHETAESDAGPSRRRARPDQPVARPLPPRPRPMPRADRPIARPFREREAPPPDVSTPLPPIAPPVFEVLFEGRVDRPGETSAPAPTIPPPRVPSAMPPQPTPAAPERTARRPSLAAREERHARQVEQRLGHVLPLATRGPEPPPSSSALGGLGRDVLRRAIVWNEILAPPLSLRMEHDPL